MKKPDELDKKLYGNDTISIYGPYGRADARQHIILYKADRNRWTISYPKYLMERKLERRLAKDETVDHINNMLNENTENFQLLSRGDNIRKSALKVKEVQCVCGKMFTQKRKMQVFCSNPCRYKYKRHNNQYTKQ